MLRIAICDDSPDELEEIRQLTREFLRIRSEEAELSVFDHPDAMLNAAEKTVFHLYLLDIVMPMVNGIQVGRELRRSAVNAPIIYLTVSQEFALEAFGVKALQYLLKPVPQGTFNAAMEQALALLRVEQGRTIVLKEGGQFRAVATADILYTEAHDKLQLVHLRNGETLSVRISAQKLFEQLRALGDFVRCGATFTLNLRHIRRLDQKEAFMGDGSRIMIPRRSFGELKQAYFGFFRERETG